MKKVLGAVLLLTVVSSYADSSKLVSIDSLRLMEESKEGQLLAGLFQKEVESFRSQVKAEQDKLLELKEKLDKQAKVLSREARLEKEEELMKMKKTAERTLQDREESLKNKVQRQQFALRDKQMKVANEVFKKNDWGLMIDKNTPGVLFVNNSIDKTKEMLKAVDQKYEEETTNVTVEKSETKKVKTA
ncbi:MAG: OmpH family outer membrane protein [bacterium]